jgi:hypothetical protein
VVKKCIVIAVDQKHLDVELHNLQVMRKTQVELSGNEEREILLDIMPCGQTINLDL